VAVEPAPDARLAAPVAAALARGGVIPAHPLALTRDRRLDERRQRALSRYYIDAGAVGLAIGVHTTQFAIRDPAVGLLQPVLALGREVMDRADARVGGGELRSPQPERGGSKGPSQGPFSATTRGPLVRIAGVCGVTAQAVAEARLARDLGYHLGLLSLAALPRASDDELIAHARAVGEVLPLMGFYLQPAVGGRPLGRDFWRRLCELPTLAAIKVAPFDRYQTLEVLHGVRASGRAGGIALYTGNDDAIVADLITPFHPGHGDAPPLRFVGGLLGQWAVWTRRAVELADRVRAITAAGAPVPPDLLMEAAQLTDANAALFDAANRYAGCIPGIHEALRRQGLLAHSTCLDPTEALSPGQLQDIDRVHDAYPHLRDDGFVAENLDRWLNG
jgi:dihydrodipicolinate synthase/N-acetylneuraminate lyase